MCFDRLTDDDTAEASVTEVLTAEWFCALRNGALAAAIVLAVLLAQGTPAWVVFASAVGAVVLGSVLHQALLLVGWGVLRARARWGDGRDRSAA
ncbi:hypothetical protein NDI56_03255 [Haloarcula sp. S1CR25-12]|uniref:Uncharacterized protein n=1 Tax=Haloarcula saliterrae TaxID=2950534 RepID=A0ABU2F9M9_9EURY|nr:hypothetical protein [Haloarcula sp. S1CR25-12]MDS0258425.1 hypothetical protein [Haloarcula sp. S1CR25-12]